MLCCCELTLFAMIERARLHCAKESTNVEGVNPS